MKDNSIEINIFIAYSQADKEFRNELETHLKILKRQGFVNTWYDREIAHGKRWDNVIAEKLMTVDIILMIISPDFLKSDYSNNSEVKKALELHKEEKVDLIPIVFKECDWKKTPFYQLMSLPDGGKPVMDSRYWYSTDEAFVNIGKALKKIIKARKEIKELEIKSQSEIIKRGTKKIQAPGGPLLPNVVNYIERPADKQLKVLLKHISAPMFLIIGGIQCGKTSLINRFLKEAEEKRYNKVIHVDFIRLLNTNKNPGIKDVFTYILDKTIEDLTGKKPGNWTFKNEFDEATPVGWATDELKEILEEHLEEENNAFLVIDSIDKLHRCIKSQEKTEQLIQWLEMLRTHQDSTPFDRLTVIAVMTILSYSSARVSPLITQAANLTLPNFGNVEIETLLRLMGMNINSKANAEKIFNLFGGHPHLSHLAVYELCSGKIFSDIKKDAINLIGGYGSYWRRIKRMMEFAIQKSDSIDSIDLIFKSLVAENRSPIQYRILNNLFEALHILGLVEMNHQISSDFIKSAIKKEVEKNEAI